MVCEFHKHFEYSGFQFIRDWCKKPNILPVANPVWEQHTLNRLLFAEGRSDPQSACGNALPRRISRQVQERLSVSSQRTLCGLDFLNVFGERSLHGVKVFLT